MLNHLDLHQTAARRKIRRRVLLRAVGPTIAGELELARVALPVFREARRQVENIALPMAAQARQQLAVDTLPEPPPSGFPGPSPLIRDDVAGLGVFFRRLREYLEQRFDGLAPVIMEIFLDEEQRHRRSFAGSVSSVLGVDLAAIIRGPDVRAHVEAAVERHVGLIRGVGDDLAKRVSTTILESASRGEAARSLSVSLGEQFGWANKRSKFIARDQMATFNGTLNRVRQQQVGVNEYEWVTSRDERVRPLHRQRHGRTYRWDEPPSDGHPGEPINCRCIARAIISE